MNIFFEIFFELTKTVIEILPGLLAIWLVFDLFYDLIFKAR